MHWGECRNPPRLRTEAGARCWYRTQRRRPLARSASVRCIESVVLSAAHGRRFRPVWPCMRVAFATLGLGPPKPQRRLYCAAITDSGCATGRVGA